MRIRSKSSLAPASLSFRSLAGCVSNVWKVIRGCQGKNIHVFSLDCHYESEQRMSAPDENPSAYLLQIIAHSFSFWFGGTRSIPRSITTPDREGCGTSARRSLASQEVTRSRPLMTEATAETIFSAASRGIGQTSQRRSGLLLTIRPSERCFAVPNKPDTRASDEPKWFGHIGEADFQRRSVFQTGFICFPIGWWPPRRGGRCVTCRTSFCATAPARFSQATP